MDRRWKRHFYSGIGLLLAAGLVAAAPARAASDSARTGGGDHGMAYSEFTMGVFLLESDAASRAIPHLEAAWMLSEHDRKIGRLLADAYYRVGDFTSSGAVLDDLLEADPEDAEAILQLARLRHASDEPFAALGLLMKLRSMGRSTFESECLIARIELDQGNDEGALDAYDRAAHLDGGYPVVHYRRGTLLLGFDRREEAEAAFRRAIELMPTYAEAVTDLAELLILEGRFDEADTALSALLAQEGDFHEAMLMSASLLAELGKREQAIDILERRATSLPRQGVILLGRLYYEVERYGDALAVFEAIYNVEPRTAELARVLGELSLKVGDAAGAVSYYRGAIEIEPDNFRNYMALFFVSSEEFRETEAPKVNLLPREQRELLDAARNVLAPDDFDGYYIVGIAYQAVNDYVASQALLEQAIRLRPDDERALLNLAAVLEQRGDYEGALVHLAHLHSSQPDDPAVCNFYGYILTLMKRDLDRAETLIRTALQQEPDNGYYVDSLGWVYYQKGQYEKAVEALEKALGLAGSDPVILEHLGDAYRALGQYEKALAAYEESLGLDGDAEELLVKIEAARSRLGDE